MGIAAVNFQNILVIDLGQLGDVVQSLPALGALRQRFPDSKITAMVEKTPAEVVRLYGAVDEIVEIDRPQLKDKPKHWSILQLFRLVARTRRSKFDLVVDLHSLYETNILGFLSGTKHRLFANRESRSLDFLSNFRPKPPVEDKSAHISDRYLDVLAPLEVETRRSSVGLKPAPPDVEYPQMLWAEHKLNGKKGVIGLFPGAGHPSRCWDLTNFAALAKRLFEKKLSVVVFLGPEEAGLSKTIEAIFPPGTRIFQKLTISQFIAVISRLSAFIGNDTGPLHLASAADIPVLGLFDSGAPLTYKPLAEKVSVINSGRISEITVDEVFEATFRLLEGSA